MELGVTDSDLLKAGDLIGKTHDFGKYSSFFQTRMKDNKRYNKELSSHSPMSAAYAAWAANRILGDTSLVSEVFFCVYAHHGNLRGRWDSLADELRRVLNNNNCVKQLESILQCYDQVSREVDRLSLPSLRDFAEDFKLGMNEVLRSLIKSAYEKHENFERYYRTLLLFSVLLDADKKSAAKLQAVERTILPRDAVDQFIASSFADRNTDRNKRMANFRNELYADALNSFAKILQNGRVPRIMTLTAPTGSGKTLIGLSVALKLADEIRRNGKIQPRIIYVLPYINIIEQTYDVFRDVIGIMKCTARDMPITLLLKQHHLYVPVPSPDGEKTLDELLLLSESWESELVVTTFVQLMETLIGTRNRTLKKFHKLYNSILILDEAQTLPVEHWLLIRETLTSLVRYTNSHVIFMTATQPMIIGDATELIPNRDRRFKALNRVAYQHLEEQMSVERAAEFVLEKWRGASSILVVLNKISTSIELYRRIRDRLAGQDPVLLGKDQLELNNERGPVVAYLSTNIVPWERLRRISKVKQFLREKRKLIMVSTQLVEAGVDLDFDSCVRDIGPVDSIIQVGGRCNRNWENNIGEVYVIRIAGERGFSDSVQTYGELTIKYISEPLFAKWRQFSESDILRLLNEYYEMVSKKLGTETSDTSRRVLDAVRKLDFDAISGYRLIEDSPKAVVFVEVDEQAHATLEEFKELWCMRHSDFVDPYEFRAKLRLQRTRLEEYLIDTWHLQGLPSDRIADDLDVRYAKKSDLACYYDLETGLRSADPHTRS